MSNYSLLHELMASPDEPMPAQLRTHQLTRMWQGLASIEQAEKPTVHDWRLCSDAVNLMETLVVNMKVCEDASGLLQDAVAALAVAGKRHVKGKNIRLDGLGIQAIRAVLEGYAKAIETVPHRTIVQCHRKTEARIKAILKGRRQPHDVEIILI